MSGYKHLYLLTYSHRCGTDVSLYHSKDDRLRGACWIIISWWDEIADRAVRNELREHLRYERWQEAVDLWHAYQDGDGQDESFHFHEDALVALEYESPVTIPAPPAED